MTEQQKGLTAALLSPIFLGASPILGKIALNNGAEPFTIAALRTACVVGLLWVGYRIFWPQYLYIYSAGLIACIAIGVTNGLGSLFYYNGLHLLDASVAQMLNATYLVFVVLLTRIEGTRINWLTLLRVGVAMVGIMLITGGLTGDATWLGIGYVLGNAILFAGTVVMSQRVLYEMPAQTATLYIMTSMGAVVVLARLISQPSLEPMQSEAWWAIGALGITTMFSRFLLFVGVKGVGGLRTSLLAILESAIAVSLSFLILDEHFTPIQWAGVVAVCTSLFIPTQWPNAQRNSTSIGEWLPNIAGLRFYRMSNAEKSKLSTQEMRQMVNLLIGPTDQLSQGEQARLIRLLGEDGFQKLQEMETKLKK
jgi:drug/metabolite transporter (DMT)-like permease